MRHLISLQPFLVRFSEPMAAILCSHSRGDSDDERFGYFALALLRRHYSLQRRRALYLGRGMRREAGLESGIIPWG